MLAPFDTIILDMNATFMFGHDRFTDFAKCGVFYPELGGSLSSHEAARILTLLFDYLAQRYPDPVYRENFPSVRAALDVVVPGGVVTEKDLNLLVETFAHTSNEERYRPSLLPQCWNWRRRTS